jgi:hypothetical protein
LYIFCKRFYEESGRNLRFFPTTLLCISAPVILQYVFKKIEKLQICHLVLKRAYFKQFALTHDIPRRGVWAMGVAPQVIMMGFARVVGRMVLPKDREKLWSHKSEPLIPVILEQWEQSGVQSLSLGFPVYSFKTLPDPRSGEPR